MQALIRPVWRFTPIFGLAFSAWLAAARSCRSLG